MSTNQYDKVLRLRDKYQEYMIFLTEDSKVDSCLVFTHGWSIGQRIDFSALPYEIKQRVEDELDPHEL